MNDKILLMFGIATDLWLYILPAVMFLAICYLLYQRKKLLKGRVAENEYHQFVFDILDNLPFPIMIKDIEDDFKYTYWNKESELQSGIPRENVIGKNDIQVFGPVRGRKYRDIDKNLVTKGEAYRSAESYKTVDGTIRDTIVVKSVVPSDKVGKRLLVVRWDVTQLREYEKELVTAKEQLEEALRKQELALRSIDFGLVYIDKNFRVQWETTDQIQQLVTKHRYIPGQICYETTGLENAACRDCVFKAAVQSGKMMKRMVNVEGLNFEVSATPVYDNGGKELIGGLLRIEDVTKKLEFDNMLREAKEKAEESNRLKSAFLANMSHEIRTPLNAIVGFSDMICQSNDPVAQAEFKKIVHVNNDLLLQLIDDILDLSKIEAGTMEYCYDTTDINELIEGVCFHMNQKNQNPKVVIQFTEKEPVCSMVTDSQRLLQVLNNLVGNAMKFTEQGSITMGYRMNASRDEIRFFVRDTGIGIAADQVDKIFDRFVKLNSFVKGTGLGLAICRIIVEHFGGTIGVESKEGEGSCFWFSLPLDPPSLISAKN